MTEPESPETAEFRPPVQRPEEPAPPPPGPDAGWVLVRDVLSFQVKLALDALRDLFLSPIAIMAAIFGAVFNPRDPGKYFYSLMRWGRRSDHFIGLFNAGLRPEERDEFTSVDDIVETLEEAVRNEEKRGGMTAEARAHMEEAIRRLDTATHPERRRLTWQVKRLAVRARQEVRKVRDQISGPGASR